jgi:hypothetical protein
VKDLSQGLAFVVLQVVNMPPKTSKRRPKAKPRKETPVERATREYYENASDEVIAEENEIAEFLQAAAAEIIFDEDQ